jgi:glutathionylspermidine synthase
MALSAMHRVEGLVEAVQELVVNIFFQKMIRINIAPRNMWQHKVEELGFGFHSTDAPYWDETAAYIFTSKQVDAIETATNKLWEMCLTAVQHVIDKKLYQQFAIPQYMIPYIEQSWEQDVPSIYGRFDLAYSNGEIKLLEFNADTPTSLFEAGIIQWFWLKDFDDKKDQFNGIHEQLIAYWKHLKPFLKNGPLHFTCVTESLEDLTNTEYLRDCAMQAGIETKLIYISDIGWDEQAACFIDLEEEPISNIFKLYPWEWLCAEDFGKNILKDTNQAFWIEPAWKMILSNKAILEVLWNLYPYHPYLLKTQLTANGMQDYVKKPILSREGANVTIVKNGSIVEHTEGEYGADGYVFQEFIDLQTETGMIPIIGSWIIGGEAAGMGIRESNNLITNNTSRFVPHYMEH